MTLDCDLLVCSTDSFLPEAKITIAQLRLLGIASSFDCYLSLGDKKPDVEGFTVLNRRTRGTWSSELYESLAQLKKGYVLLWLDDFVPLKIASIGRIEQLISQFIELDGDYLRLNPTPPGRGPKTFSGVQDIPSGSIYRTSTIFSVWRREMLMDLLNAAENAWQFELLGSARSDKYEKFYAYPSTLIDCVNLVVKGLLDPRAEQRLVECGINLCEVTRPRMTALQLTALWLKEIRSKLLGIVPWQFRRSVRSAFQSDFQTKSLPVSR